MGPGCGPTFRPESNPVMTAWNSRSREDAGGVADRARRTEPLTPRQPAPSDRRFPRLPAWNDQHDRRPEQTPGAVDADVHRPRRTVWIITDQGAATFSGHISHDLFDFDVMAATLSKDQQLPL